MKRNLISIRIILFSLIAVVGSCNEHIHIPIPPHDSHEAVSIIVGIKGDTLDEVILSAFVVKNSDTLYRSEDWALHFPECSRPTFKWSRVVVRADTIDKKVKYDSTEYMDEGIDLWEENIPLTELQWGTWYYKVRLTYDSLPPDQPLVGLWKESAGSLPGLFRTSHAYYIFADPIAEKASEYIRVPYVLGTATDINGEPVGKTHYNGFFGLDCSGLATYAYNAVGENLSVNYTNTGVLRSYYKKEGIMPDDTGLLQTGDLIFVAPWGSRHVMTVGPYTTFGTHEERFIIHATGNKEPEHENPDSSWYYNYNLPRSTVIEHITFRWDWLRNTHDNFRAVGRRPRNTIKDISKRR